MPLPILHLRAPKHDLDRTHTLASRTRATDLPWRSAHLSVIAMAPALLGSSHRNLLLTLIPRASGFDELGQAEVLLLFGVEHLDVVLEELVAVGLLRELFLLVQAIGRYLCPRHLSACACAFRWLLGCAQLGLDGHLLGRQVCPGLRILVVAAFGRGLLLLRRSLLLLLLRGLLALAGLLLRRSLLLLGVLQSNESALLCLLGGFTLGGLRGLLLLLTLLGRHCCRNLVAARLRRKRQPHLFHALLLVALHTCGLGRFWLLSLRWQRWQQSVHLWVAECSKGRGVLCLLLVSLGLTGPRGVHSGGQQLDGGDETALVHFLEGVDNVVLRARRPRRLLQ
mmetsp:Transcript_51498/g.130868  ORF Transcript_51498/g.130868 Transcript_51498/m.130868 type:complete len:338 (+) Transcript_51498:96-1109(+)